MTEAVKPPTKKTPFNLTQYDKDRRPLEIMGATYFEGLSNDDLESQLNELNLDPLRHNQEHNFQLGMKDEDKEIFSIDRRHADQLPVGCPEDDIWLERPVATTSVGGADATVGNTNGG
ncbi:unnamed protein product [Tilletia caries]|nr:unnamed protein product [Tilletia caries]